MSVSIQDIPILSVDIEMATNVNTWNYGQQSQLWSTVPIMDSSHNYEQQIPITDNSPNYGQQSQFWTTDMLYLANL